MEEIILPATHFLEATQDGDILGVICKMATAIVSNSQNSRIDELDEPTTGHDHIVVSWEFTGNDLNLPLLSKAIPGLVGIFLSRFQDQRHHCDLDYSIYLLEIMTQLLDTSTFSTVSELHNVYFMLVILHAIRYYLIKEPVHLDNLIGAFEAFLEETHGSPDYATHGAKLSLGLAMGLLDRSGSSNTPNAKDCDRVLQLYDNIYPLTFGDTRQTWDRVRSLALRFLSRSRRTFQDLTGALKHIRSVDDTVFISDKDAVPSDVEFLIFQLRAAAIAGDRELLLKVGEELKAPMSRCSLGAQFNMPIFLFWNDSEESLGDAIRTMKDRCRACSEEDPCRRLYSIVLAMALFSRFNRHSDDQDIKEALAFREPFGADEVFKVDLVLLALSEDVMGAKFGSKNRWPLPETVKTRAYFPNLFVKTDPRVFDRSSNAFKDISQWDVLGPDGRQLVSIFDALNDAGNNKKFHNLREWLQSRCRVEGDDPTEHLLDLCRLYDRRYRFTKQIEDLETSADYYLQALNHTNTLPYETYSLIDILFELERLKPGSIAPSQLLGRFDSLLEIAHNTATPLPYRLDSIASCFFFFDHPHVADQRISHALEMGNLALSLIEQQCWASPTPHASLSSRYIFRSLFSIAPNIIMLADPDNMPRAIEIFEMGRSLVWNQLENLRTPPNELASVTPGLSTQFLEISRTLERRMGFSHEVGIEPLGTYPQQLVEERNRIIEQIRALPGCENFLGPQSFNQLRLAAPVEGPVVILMSTIVDRSVAVVFFHANSSVLYLPITPDHLKRLNSSLRANPSTRDADYGGSSDDLFTPSTSTDMDSRVGVRLPRSKLDAYDILAELWDKVAKPVIDRIGEMMVDGEKGKGKAGIPVSCSILTI